MLIVRHAKKKNCFDAESELLCWCTAQLAQFFAMHSPSDFVVHTPTFFSFATPHENVAFYQIYLCVTLFHHGSSQ